MASKEDLDRIRNHFNKSGGRSSGSDRKWFKVPDPQGNEVVSASVRILGPWSKEANGFPYYIGGLHYGVRIAGNNRALACPEASDPQRGSCPACMLVSSFNESGKYKKTAERLRLSRRYWVNLIDRADEDAGVKLFGSNKKFIEAILDASDEGNVWSYKKGRDMVIKRRGIGFNTRYTYSFRNKSTPLDISSLKLYDLDKDVQEWMSYQQMVEVLKANFSEEIAKLGVRFKKSKSEAVEVEEKPKKKKKKAKLVEEEEIEDEDIDEDEDEEQDEEDSEEEEVEDEDENIEEDDDEE